MSKTDRLRAKLQEFLLEFVNYAPTMKLTDACDLITGQADSYRRLMEAEYTDEELIALVQEFSSRAYRSPEYHRAYPFRPMKGIKELKS